MQNNYFFFSMIFKVLLQVLVVILLRCSENCSVLTSVIFPYLENLGAGAERGEPLYLNFSVFYSEDPKI